MTRFANVLDEYPADVLKELAYNDKSLKYTKYDAIVKIHLLILDKFKDIKALYIPLIPK